MDCKNMITLSLLVGLFIYGLVHMFKLYREIKVHSYISRLEKLVLLLAAGLFIYLAYSYGEGLIAYILAFLASLVLTMMTLTSGASEEGLIFLRGRGIRGIDLIVYEDFRVVKIREKKAYIELEAPSPEALAIIRFRLEDKDRLLDLIQGVKLEVGD